jgi:hypothetical protein
VGAGARDHRLDVDALPDGHIAAVGDGRYALVAEPTDRDGHRALGDGIEPTALLIADVTEPAVTAWASLEPRGCSRRSSHWSPTSTGTDGLSSHTYRSRIIDGTVAGDIDADGQVEVPVPPTDRRRLAAVRRAGTGAAIGWQLALEGRLASNVTGVGTRDDGLAIGAATNDVVQVRTG